MQSVLTALRVLEAVAEGQPAGLTGLSRRLGVPKSTVQRCLLTLASAGWVRPVASDGSKWVLSLRVLKVSNSVDSVMNLREAALPIMRSLQQMTDETIHLTVVEGEEMVLVERLNSLLPVAVINSVGMRSPLHTLSNGKAVLAALTDAEVAAYLAKPLEPVTEKTLTSPSSLWEDIALTRRRGYSVNVEERHLEVCAVAAAILSPDGRPFAAMSISCPMSRFGSGRQGELGRLVSAARDQVSKNLFGSSSE